MPRPPDPDEVAALAELATRLDKLTRYPEWADLRDAMEKRREITTRGVTKRVMNGAITQEEVTRHAGYWKGVFDVLDKPSGVGKKLETALRRAQQTEGDET
jgi:hypothetical protein